MNLLAPITWDHHLVLALPAVLHALKEIEIGKVGWLWSIMVIGAISALGLKFFFRDRSFMPGILPLFISFKVYALLILFMGLYIRKNKNILRHNS